MTLGLTDYDQAHEDCEHAEGRQGVVGRWTWLEVQDKAKGGCGDVHDQAQGDGEQNPDQPQGDAIQVPEGEEGGGDGEAEDQPQGEVNAKRFLLGV